MNTVYFTRVVEKTRFFYIQRERMNEYTLFYEGSGEDDVFLHPERER